MVRVSTVLLPLLFVSIWISAEAVAKTKKSKPKPKAKSEKLTPEQHKDRACDDFLKDKTFRFTTPSPAQACAHQHTQALEICRPQSGKISSPQAHEFHKGYCPLHLSTKEVRSQAHLYVLPLPKNHAKFLEINHQVEKKAEALSSRASTEYAKKLSNAMGQRDLYHHEACIKAVSACSKACKDDSAKQDFCGELWRETHKMADFANNMLETSLRSSFIENDSTDYSRQEMLDRVASLAVVGVGIAATMQIMENQERSVAMTSTVAPPAITPAQKRKYQEPTRQRINPTVSTLLSSIAEYKKDNRPRKVDEAVRQLIELDHLDQAEKEILELESSDNFALSNVGKKLRRALEEKQLYSGR